MNNSYQNPQAIILAGGLGTRLKPVPKRARDSVRPVTIALTLDNRSYYTRASYA